MLSRKERYQKKRKSTHKKIVISILFSIICVVSSIGVVFADNDISQMLTEWFNKKGQESFSEIDHAIDQEVKKQIEHVKKELKVIISSANEDYIAFTKEEKEKSIKEIQDYANYLINSYPVDNQKEKEKYIQHVDRIVRNAMKQLDNIPIKNKKEGVTIYDNNDKESINGKGDGEATTEEELSEEESSSEEETEETSEEG